MACTVGHVCYCTQDICRKREKKRYAVSHEDILRIVRINIHRGCRCDVDGDRWSNKCQCFNQGNLTEQSSANEKTYARRSLFIRLKVMLDESSSISAFKVRFLANAMSSAR